MIIIKIDNEKFKEVRIIRTRVIQLRLHIVIIFSILLAMLIIPSVKAAETLDDGRYTIDFEILNGDANNDSTSLADGYWNKPATVIVKNGELTVQTEINQQAWVLEFSTKINGSFKNVKNVSINANANTRIDEFKVASLEEILESQMHIVVDTIDYDHHHKVRFKFFTDTLKPISASEPAGEQIPAKEKEPEATKAPVLKEEAPKPKPSEKTPASTPPAAIQETTKPVEQDKLTPEKPDATNQAAPTPGSDITDAQGEENQEQTATDEPVSAQETEDSTAIVEEPDENQTEDQEQLLNETTSEAEAEGNQERGVNRVILFATIIGLILAVVAFIIFPKKSKQ